MCAYDKEKQVIYTHMQLYPQKHTHKNNRIEQNI